MTPGDEPNFTVMEEKLLGFLVVSSKPNKAMMMNALYGDMLNPPDQKILDVMVCNLRRKLLPYGIAIQTHWGRGHYLTQADKEDIAGFEFMKLKQEQNR